MRLRRKAHFPALFGIFSPGSSPDLSDQPAAGSALCLRVPLLLNGIAIAVIAVSGCKPDGRLSSGEWSPASTGATNKYRKDLVTEPPTGS